MFICDPCREQDYTNDASIRRSYGRCECCNKPAHCSDIPSKHLWTKSRSEAPEVVQVELVNGIAPIQTKSGRIIQGHARAAALAKLNPFSPSEASVARRFLRAIGVDITGKLPAVKAWEVTTSDRRTYVVFEPVIGGAVAYFKADVEAWLQDQTAPRPFPVSHEQHVFMAQLAVLAWLKYKTRLHYFGGDRVLTDDIETALNEARLLFTDTGPLWGWDGVVQEGDK